MPMAHHGMAKLLEECGEVGQIAGKLLAFPIGDFPERDARLLKKLEDELGDLRASIAFVTVKLGLDRDKVHERTKAKMELYLQWDKEKQEPKVHTLNEPVGCECTCHNDPLYGHDCKECACHEQQAARED